MDVRSTEEYLEQVRTMFNRSPWARFLGQDTVTAERGLVTVELPIGRHLFNAAGDVHPGAIATIADTALAAAVATAANSGDFLTTADLALYTVRPTRAGRLRATGRVREQEGSFAVGDLLVEEVDTGAVVAVGTSGYAVKAGAGMMAMVQEFELPLHRWDEVADVLAPYDALTGAEVAESDAEHAVVRMPVGLHHINGGRVVHGGVMASLAYIAADAVLRAAQAPANRPVSLKFDLLRSATEGELIANGRLLRSGRTLSTVAVDLVDDRGNLVGHGTVTSAVPS